MQAAVFREINQPLVVEQRETPEPNSGEVLVRLKAAALNRRDYWITQGRYPGIRSGVIQGSDGAGVVEKVGSDVDTAWKEKEIVINPGLEWGNDPQVQSRQFHILGMPADGTFAEAIIVPFTAIYEKPSHLDWHSAAALPLTGVTAYRAVTRAKVNEGSVVLITGIGGGVALMAMQICQALGARVLVTSSSEEKLHRALEFGAVGGFLYSQDDWPKQMLSQHGPVDTVIDGAGGAGYRHLLQVTGPGGCIVNYGATAGPPETMDLSKLFWKQLKLIGSTMGSPDDFQQMLRLGSQNNVTPVIDSVHSLVDVNKALGKMMACEQFGKLVISLS